jgi:hypothetical protein
VERLCEAGMLQLMFECKIWAAEDPSFVKVQASALQLAIKDVYCSFRQSIAWTPARCFACMQQCTLPGRKEGGGQQDATSVACSGVSPVADNVAAIVTQNTVSYGDV